MSNRLTFSLASLVLIFGLVFVATPAMAHLANADGTITNTGTIYRAADHDGLDTDGTTPLTGPALVAETDHIHRDAPTVTGIELVDVKIGADDTAREMASAESTVQGTSVVLVNNAVPADTDAVTETDLTGSADGEFRVKITFSEGVYLFDEATSTDPVDPAAADNDLPSTSILFVAVSDAATGVTLPSAASVAEIARDGDNDDTFLATVIVANANLSDVPMTVWVSVNANAVFSKAQFNVNPPEQRHGQGNAASSRFPFQVVSSLDTTLPVVTITPDLADGATLPDTGVVTFTIASDKALRTALMVDDIMVAGGTKALSRRRIRWIRRSIL